MRKLLHFFKALLKSRQEPVSYPVTNEFIYTDGKPIQVTYDY